MNMTNMLNDMNLMLITLAQDDAANGASWLDTVRSGGVIGFIIIALSVVAGTLIVMHFLQIRRKSLLPQEQLEALDGMLARGDVNGAAQYCLQPENDSYLTRILGAGLLRFQKSAFGAFEIKNAIEEAGEDQTARLFRSTDALGVIGSISPLLGLLGTVLGMVGAFETVSRSAGSNHEALAENISLALVTTLLGLIVAIPVIAFFTFFRNRIDALASEAAIEIERLVLHLESGGGAGAAAPMRAGAPPMSGPARFTPAPAIPARPRPQTAPVPPAPQPAPAAPRASGMPATPGTQGGAANAEGAGS